MRLPGTMKMLSALLAVGVIAAAVTAVGIAKMRAERVDKRLCKTVGGGRFVSIPGFPGERIDRRLLRDVRWMVRRYKIFVTDGYSTDPVHSKKGEHPIGLALDIVPNKAAGGRWRDISRLARWAEPSQDRPRPPFRWVGYNGDPGHGRGNHLHLSWAHSPAKFGKPARTVYSIRCPRGGRTGAPAPPDGGAQTPGGDREADGRRSTGGLSPGGRVRGTESGGISARKVKRKIRRQRNVRTSRESGGVGVR
jgi:hypothetical protein